MDWYRFFMIVVGAGTLSTVTDWLLAGEWKRKHFGDAEIWRDGSHWKATLLTALLTFLTCAAFAFTAHRLDIDSMRNVVKLAAAIWVIGPLPLILTAGGYMKLHRVFVVSYSISWLVKLMIVAVLVGRFLR